MTDEDPLRYFRVEARELVEQLTQGVLDIELAGVEPPLVARLLRAAHTLKGAARVVGRRELADRAHALEELLVPHRQDTGPVPRDTVATLLTLADEMAAAVAALPAAGVGGNPAADVPAAPPREPARPAPAPVGPVPAAAAPADERVAARTDSRDVDELLDAIGEAHAQAAPLHRHAAAVERLRRSAELLADRLHAQATHDGGPVPEPDRAAADRLARDLRAVGRHLTDAVAHLDRELDEVRRRAERLRLVPAGGVFGTLRRAVRDAAEAEDKQVAFEATGGDLRLDPQVLTLVGDALLHVVRNAVAHGVEPPADRAAVGKPAQGRVLVEAHRRGRRAVFRCRDDGRGFDVAGLRRAAAYTGWRGTGDDARDLPELVGLLMRGGVSTAAQVTATAGRGVGLDVVRDVADQLGGEVAVDTAPGRGSTIELEVPLTVLALRGLHVRAAGGVVTLPLDAVRGCVRLSPEDTAQARSSGVVPYGGHLLPFRDLAEVLSGGGAAPAGYAVAVVVAADGRTAAVGADALLGMSTMVVRPLPDLAVADRAVGGVTVDTDGVPRAVLDPLALVTGPEPAAPRRAAAPAPAPQTVAPRRVLVVDDSLTTRMLERSILESAGYRVDLAASGEEGLRKAADGGYALILVDVEMPGIDGFTFLERLRADQRLADIPAIMLSSRAAAEDRRRGVAAGAQAYLVKSEFDQGELLARIRDLVGA